MIIVRIWEGLGNQMFQYAYARALQLRTGNYVYLDTDKTYKTVLESGVTERNYLLDKFNIKLPIARNVENKYFFLEQKSILHQIMFWMSGHHIIVPGFYREENTLYKEELKYIKGNQYMMGWFQNVKYFEEYKDVLLRDLTPKKKIKISSQLRQVLKDQMTVAVHIRRGDFKRHDNVLPVSYYENAKKYIEDQIKNPYYVIFTDDVEWVKRELDFGTDVFYVTDEGLQDYEELLVMSRCRHDIIANSTFSWWGAWLNQNKEKIVVGPTIWFNHGRDGWNHNIMPDDWIRVECNRS